MNEKLMLGLELLENKISNLVAINAQLKIELQAKATENEGLKAELKSKNEQLINFQNKIKITKIVGHVAVDKNTAELKSKINEYIKEIDKCIAHLSG